MSDAGWTVHKLCRLSCAAPGGLVGCSARNGVAGLEESGGVGGLEESDGTFSAALSSWAARLPS